MRLRWLAARRRRSVLCMFAGALTIATTSCAQPDYEPTKLQRQLEEAGVPVEQARCVTDRLTETFDEAQLASRSEPTEREQETTRRILAGCGVTTSTISPPATPSS